MNDPLHGYIELDAHQLKLIDTPQFQRLRDLKQLGSAYYVFYGASHNRFEHSLGVSHLARTMCSHLRQKQPDLEINDRDSKCVALAGLCHDLGHGPFSHIFDSAFIPLARPGIKWTHEQGSEMLFDYLVEENGVDLGSDGEQDFIKDLIMGESRSKRHEKTFLFDIVANKRNSVDVDKFDYIQRDCFNVGLKSSYDTSRLILHSRVIQDQICYYAPEVYNLYEIFHTRYSLFKRIYTHKVGKAIELMIVDALMLADPVMRISESIDDPEQYTFMTDSILKDIEKSRDPALAEAKKIVTRLRKRQLYKFVDENTYHSANKRFLTTERINAGLIIEYHQGPETLNVDDIIVDIFSLNYGMDDKNPVDSIKFFSKYDCSESFCYPANKVSYLLPTCFEEVSVRVFARDAEKVSVIQRAYRNFMAHFHKQIKQEGGSTSFPSAQGSPVLPVLSVKFYGNTYPTRSELGTASDVLLGNYMPIVEEYEPNIRTTVPPPKEWCEIVEQRGWSPAKQKMPAPKVVRSFSANSSVHKLRQEITELDPEDLDLSSGK